MTRIQLRRDTQVNWEQFNPILGDGERAYDKTNKKWKTGDGINHWNDLPYDQGGGGGYEPDTLKGLELTEEDKMAVKIDSDTMEFTTDGKLKAKEQSGGVQDVKVDGTSIVDSDKVANLQLNEFVPLTSYGANTYYAKIGKLVLVIMQVQLTSAATSGDVILTGLPTNNTSAYVYGIVQSYTDDKVYRVRIDPNDNKLKAIQNIPQGWIIGQFMYAQQ